MAGTVAALTAIVLPQFAAPICAVGCAIEVVKNVRSAKAIEREKGGKESGADGADAERGKTLSSGLKPVTLTWKDVSLEIQGNKPGKHVLKNCAGEARPGRLMAIMGPSGAGKTTLINALAGQIPYAPKEKLTGTVLCNSKLKNNEGQQAYVTQNSYFFSCLTVRETLQFAARARLPDTVSIEDREKLVEDLIMRLGLSKCADTFIGNAKTPGISGGEKKRVSIASELISAPSLIFVDEPTSGLDAFQAEQVVASLKKLAEDGHTVICSIHQPRGTVFDMFDDICLIAEGEAMFCGTVEAALEHFASLGAPCPPSINPAEHFADIISIDFSSKEQQVLTRERVQKFSEAFQKEIACKIVLPAIIEGSPETMVTPHIPFLNQLGMLYKRSLRQVTRDKSSLLARIIPCISSGIMFGLIYWKVGLTQTSIQDRVGLMQVCATNAAMLSVTRTLNLFPPEKTLIDRERVRNSYSVLPYLLGKIAAELPILSVPPLLFAGVLYPMTGLRGGVMRIAQFMSILMIETAAAGAIGTAIGAIAPSTEAALALGPSVMLLFILFGGYYVNAMNVPLILRWIPRVSVIRWTFASLCMNQFPGLKFEATKEGDTRTGEQVLERFGLGDTTLAGGVKEMLRITMFFYIASYGILIRREPSFKEMEAPSDGADEDVAQTEKEGVTSSLGPAKKDALNGLGAAQAEVVTK